ncbi:hypothetical protein J1N35_040672 [Gossypium stocksii]|uniref:Uncharacterized protein n=1 Tax=Gossypium stocksii TaxID=47602 RepID=A0A9D3UE14_9ROSI|nr:hypothetical protein J1N35_040672 [Gossypium stocksii]
MCVKSAKKFPGSEVRVIFVIAQPVELVFNCTVQLYELWARIRRKLGGSSRGRILSLQFRYLALVDPFKYELFDVKAGPSSTTVMANVGTEVEAESPMTLLCGQITGLLQSSYYDVPKT